LDTVFDYSKSLLPIFTDQQFSTTPPLQYENPYLHSYPREIHINPLTTKYYYIPEINREFFLMGVMHNNQESAIEVYDFLNQYSPDTIVLEIDENRNQLLENNYSSYKPEKVMKILENNKTSLKLMFKKRLEYIVAKEQAKRIEYKKCDIIFGDVDYYEFINLLREAQHKCKCSLGIKYWFLQIWRMNKFLVTLLSIYLKRILYKRVPYTKSMMSVAENLLVTRDNCVINKVNYQRDFFMFKNIIQRSHGHRIMAIVGMFHTKNIAKFLALYQEGCQKYYPEMWEGVAEGEVLSEEELNRREEVIQAKILEYVDFDRNKVYCDHSHSNEEPAIKETSSKNA